MAVQIEYTEVGSNVRGVVEIHGDIPQTLPQKGDYTEFTNESLTEYFAGEIIKRKVNFVTGDVQLVVKATRKMPLVEQGG